MKKNENILKYLEDYKKKHDIKYSEEGSKVVKVFSIIAGVIWAYSFFWLALSTLSFWLNFSTGALQYNSFKKVFWITVACTVAMIVASVFFVIKQKIIASVIAVVSQIAVVITYKPLNVYGMGYRPKYYFSYLVPAVLLILAAICLCFVLIRAVIKNNQLYNKFVDDLYEQHGTRDGEKLEKQEWQDFLTNYNPYK